MFSTLRFFAALSLMVGLTVVLSGSREPQHAAVPALPVAVQMTPLALHDVNGLIQKGQRYGNGLLRFRGAWRLYCPHPGFGGISSLAAAGGILYALPDVGTLLTLTPHWKGTQLVALALNNVTPLKDHQGEVLPPMKRDSEGMTLAPDGSLYISFERVARVDRFAPDTGIKSGNLPLGDAITRKLSFNGGLESLVQLDPEHFLTIGEFSVNKQGNLRGWIVSRQGGEQPFFYTPAHDYGVSETRMLPSGDLLVVERSYKVMTWPWRFATRLTLVSRDQIGPGRIIVPKVLAEFDERSGADNLEAATVVDLPNGKRMLMVMSDDNFNPQQQNTTLLLFELRPANKDRAPLRPRQHRREHALKT